MRVASALLTCLTLAAVRTVAGEPPPSDALIRQGAIQAVLPMLDGRGQPIPEDTKVRNSHRMPDLLTLGPRHWMVVFTEFDWGGPERNWSRLVIRETEDAGATWTNRLVHEDVYGTTNFLGKWNMPRIARLKDGRLALTSTTMQRSRDAFALFSDDGGATWSPPRALGINRVIRGQYPKSNPVEVTRMLDLPDGSLGLFAHFPIGEPFKDPALREAAQKGLQGEERGHFNCGLFVSTDGGKDWSLRSVMPDEDKYLVCEPAPVFIGPDTLQLYCRDNRGASMQPQRPTGGLVYRSADSGKTWGWSSHIIG